MESAFMYNLGLTKIMGKVLKREMSLGILLRAQFLSFELFLLLFIWRYLLRRKNVKFKFESFSGEFLFTLSSLHIFWCFICKFIFSKHFFQLLLDLRTAFCPVSYPVSMQKINHVSSKRTGLLG